MHFVAEQEDVLRRAATVAAVGDGATRWGVVDRVCALLAGGGYAQQALVSAETVPDTLTRPASTM